MTGLKSMGKVGELKKNIKNQKHQNTFEGAVLDGGLHGGCVSLSRKEWRFFCLRSILSCLSFFSSHFSYSLMACLSLSFFSALFSSSFLLSFIFSFSFCLRRASFFSLHLSKAVTLSFFFSATASSSFCFFALSYSFSLLVFSLRYSSFFSFHFSNA